MTEAVDLSCANGCFEFEVSGGHEVRDDRAFLEDVVIADNGECPNCGAPITEVERGD